MSNSTQIDVVIEAMVSTGLIEAQHGANLIKIIDERDHENYENGYQHGFNDAKQMAANAIDKLDIEEG
jgi:hypothetical protein